MPVHIFQYGLFVIRDEVFGSGLKSEVKRLGEVRGEERRGEVGVSNRAPSKAKQRSKAVGK